MCRREVLVAAALNLIEAHSHTLLLSKQNFLDGSNFRGDFQAAQDKSHFTNLNRHRAGGQDSDFEALISEGQPTGTFAGAPIRPAQLPLHWHAPDGPRAAAAGHGFNQVHLQVGLFGLPLVLVSTGSTDSQWQVRQDGVGRSEGHGAGEAGIVPGCASHL